MTKSSREATRALRGIDLDTVDHLVLSKFAAVVEDPDLAEIMQIAKDETEAIVRQQALLDRQREKGKHHRVHKAQGKAVTTSLAVLLVADLALMYLTWKERDPRWTHFIKQEHAKGLEESAAAAFVAMLVEARIQDRKDRRHIRNINVVEGGIRERLEDSLEMLDFILHNRDLSTDKRVDWHFKGDALDLRTVVSKFAEENGSVVDRRSHPLHDDLGSRPPKAGWKQDRWDDGFAEYAAAARLGLTESPYVAAYIKGVSADLASNVQVSDPFGFV